MVAVVEAKPIDENVVQAIKSIKEFKAKLNIKSIVYIDDKFSLENLKEEFVGIIIGQKETRPNEFEFDWNKPTFALMQDVAKCWDESSKEQKEELYRLACRVTGNNDYLQNTLPTFEFSKYFEEGELRCLTPTAWSEVKDDVFNGLEKGEKLLCLIDKEFKNGEVSETYQSGIDILKEVVDGEFGDKAYCAIFSHMFSVEDEYDNWLNYAKEADIDKGSFYTVSKKRYQDEPKITGFAEGIKNVLTIKEIDSLKNKSIAIWKDALNRAEKELEQINPDTFNHIVQKTSNGEGIWEVLTFFRLGKILATSEVEKAMVIPEKRAEFNEAIRVIRELESINTGRESTYNLDKLGDIRGKELFIKGEVLNKLHLPVSLGDLFKIGTKIYILLEQPCSIALRGGDQIGRRSNNKVTGKLVQLIKTEKTNSYKIALPIEEHEYVQFGQNFQIKLDVLDLTVYNEEGKSQLELKVKDIDSSIYHAPLVKRYSFLYKELSSWANNYKQIVPLLMNKVSKQTIENSCRPILSLNKISGLNLKPFNMEIDKFDFGVTRIGRIKEPYSTDILQAFSAFQSRNGFDHDFSK